MVDHRVRPCGMGSYGMFCKPMRAFCYNVCKPAWRKRLAEEQEAKNLDLKLDKPTPDDR